MYGENGNSFIGWDSGLLFMEVADKGADNAASAGWFFQIVFAATASTIVSGHAEGISVVPRHHTNPTEPVVAGGKLDLSEIAFSTLSLGDFHCTEIQKSTDINKKL